MCGLYYSHSSFKIKNINLNKVIEDINLSIKKKKYEVALKKLRQLRCNKIFVEIIKYNNKKIKNFLKQIKSEINRNHREINFDLLSDINWVIDKEIINQSIKIKKFIFDNNL